MNTFNEGDRVSHPTRGEGTVLYPHEGTGWSTVQFDNGDKYMTDTHMLSLIPRSVEPYKYGDRVQHNLYGTATVVGSELANLVLIVPDSGANPAQVHPTSLEPLPSTLVPRKYNDGDRVSHPLHRDGTVVDYSEHSGHYTVSLGGSLAYRALGHQITPAVPEPTYHICISEITGAAHVPGNLTAKQVANYINDNVDWRVVQEIKITKEG